MGFYLFAILNGLADTFRKGCDKSLSFFVEQYLGLIFGYLAANMDIEDLSSFKSILFIVPFGYGCSVNFNDQRFIRFIDFFQCFAFVTLLTAGFLI